MPSVTISKTAISSRRSKPAPRRLSYRVWRLRRSSLRATTQVSRLSMRVARCVRGSLSARMDRGHCAVQPPASVRGGAPIRRRRSRSISNMRGRTAIFPRNSTRKAARLRWCPCPAGVPAWCACWRRRRRRCSPPRPTSARGGYRAPGTFAARTDARRARPRPVPARRGNGRRYRAGPHCAGRRGRACGATDWRAGIKSRPARCRRHRRNRRRHAAGRSGRRRTNRACPLRDSTPRRYYGPDRRGRSAQSQSARWFCAAARLCAACRSTLPTASARYAVR